MTKSFPISVLALTVVLTLVATPAQAGRRLAPGAQKSTATAVKSPARRYWFDFASWTQFLTTPVVQSAPVAPAAAAPAAAAPAAAAPAAAAPAAAAPAPMIAAGLAPGPRRVKGANPIIILLVPKPVVSNP